MGFYVTLLYLALMILSPATVVPELAAYRIQWWVIGLAMLGTAAMLPITGYPIRSLQTLLMFGFFGSVMMSRVLQGWIGGAIYAVSEFGTFAAVYFLLAGTTHTMSRLRMVAITFVWPAFYAVARGIGAVYMDNEKQTYVLDQNVRDSFQTIIDVVPRIRFVGGLADPNDLAQYLLMVLPFVTMMWRRGNVARNFGIVLPLVCYLFFGMYLTHSRGVLVGLVVVAMVYLGGRFNTTVMSLGSAAVATLLLAADFSGGRAVNLSSGSDRLEAWGAGLTMLRENPILGVGYNLFSNHHEITAHNSFVLCFSELGMVGFFFWLGLLVSTLMGLNRFVRFYRPDPRFATLVRWAMTLRLSLCGYIATSWFLSRTYSVLLYVMLAMWVALEANAARMEQPQAQSALQQPGMSGLGTGAFPWASRTAMMQFACVLVVYLMVRARWSN